MFLKFNFFLLSLFSSAIPLSGCYKVNFHKSDNNLSMKNISEKFSSEIPQFPQNFKSNQALYLNNTYIFGGISDNLQQDLLIYKNDRTFVSYNLESYANEIYNIQASNNNSIVVSSKNGVYLIPSSTDDSYIPNIYYATPIGSGSPFSNAKTTNFSLYNDKNYVAISNQGEAKYWNGSQKNSIQIDNLYFESSLTANDGTVFLGAKLKNEKVKTNTFYQLVQKENDTKIVSLDFYLPIKDVIQAKNNEVYLITVNSGIWKYDQGQFSNISEVLNTKQYAKNFSNVALDKANENLYLMTEDQNIEKQKIYKLSLKNYSISVFENYTVDKNLDKNYFQNFILDKNSTFLNETDRIEAIASTKNAKSMFLDEPLKISTTPIPDNLPVSHGLKSWQIVLIVVCAIVAFSAALGSLIFFLKKRKTV